MTAIVTPIRVTTSPTYTPPRWVRTTRDSKLRQIGSAPEFAGLGRSDITALAGVADLLHVAAGEELAIGSVARRFWWMPLEGWLQVNRDGQALVVPAGRSFCGTADRITSPRAGDVLVADVRELTGCFDEHPAVAHAIEATRV